jgi:hypothetical protein
VTTYGPDSEVYVTVATAGTSSECDLYARVSTISSGTFDGYHMACSHNTNNVVLTRIDAGVASAALATFAQAIANGDSVGMSIIGTTITAWYKAGAGAWTSLGTATDSTYGAAGYLVLEAGNNTWTFTNFGGGTALGGLPQTSKMNLVYLRRNR